jgi:mannose-6-phosphate isomerase
MADLYPLLMKPVFDPRPWGRFDLSPIYSHAFREKIGESWLTGDNCVVQNGPLQGKSLAQLSAQYKRELVGNAPRDEPRFPLLMKFLFPAEKLSIQVHPDDAAAQEIGEPCGKTECWYVAHAGPGAEVGLGLKPGATRADFERAIHENRAEELLNWIPVLAGDMVYVAGGTVHTLGPGSIIVETQQQSDTTFRLYDYGRPRELHLENGLRVIKESAHSGKVARLQQLDNGSSPGQNRYLPLVAAPCFVVERYGLTEPAFLGTRDQSEKSSVQIVVAIEGLGSLEVPGSEVSFAMGDAVVVPASFSEFSIHPRPRIAFIRAYVPGQQLPEPPINYDSFASTRAVNIRG